MIELGSKPTISKIEAVTDFIMDGMTRILAGSWEDTYMVGTPEAPAFVQFAPDGNVGAEIVGKNEIEVEFGGDTYRVKVTKVRR